ncbi:hypothetical protein MKC76_14880 [[Clostridium] innocuum]|nr:hypothetical protein [[Clostridium] innocuum]MCR0446053.1 hypothetical protein [[Clostridium] innocuum]DAF72108.1 MAG TPA: Pre-mRNA-splicing factor 8, Pre-mRNA-splicing factor-mRNA splicing, spliceosome, post-catalytic, P [Caudoviricetes sp.]
MKIIAPNKNYTGISAGVVFAKGIAECKDPRVIEWFENHGYTVTDTLPEDGNDNAIKNELSALQAEHDEVLAENVSLKAEIESLRAKLAEAKKPPKK